MHCTRRKTGTGLVALFVVFGLLSSCSAPEDTGDTPRVAVEQVEMAELPGSVERWLDAGHVPESLPPHLKSAAGAEQGELCGDASREAIAWGSAAGPLVHFHNVGDVDGDGHDDLLVVLQASHGWPMWSPARDGRAFLFYGPVTAERLPLSLEAADAEFRLDIARAAFGTLAFGAGDLTGNGIGDVVLGTPMVDMDRRRGHAARWPGLPGFLDRWRGGVVFILEGRSERYAGVVDVESAAWTELRGVGRLSGGREIEPGLGGYGHALGGDALGCGTAGALALSLANSSEVLVVCGDALVASEVLAVTPDLTLREGMAVLRYPERHGVPRPPHFGFSRRAAFGHAMVEVGEDVVMTVPVAEARGARVRTELAVVGRDHLAQALAGAAEMELDTDAAAVRLVTYESTRRRVFTALYALEDGRVVTVVDSLLPGPSFIHALTLPARGAGLVELHEVRDATLTLPWPQEFALGAGTPADSSGLAGTFHGAARPFLGEGGHLSSLVFLDQGGAAFAEGTDGAGVPAEERMEPAMCTGGLPLLHPGHAAAFALNRTPGEDAASRLWLLPLLDFPHPHPWLFGQASSRYWVEEAAHCGNGVLDGDETGVDCGGRCGGCPVGGPCTVNEDCETLSCGSGICLDPDETCEDGAEPNACGGCEELPEELGDPCGECGLGSVACAGPDEVQCTGDPGRNACGGCALLPVEPGDPCGPCELDTTFCDGEDAVGCSGATFANACGTCGIGDFCSPPANELPDDLTTILGGGPATSHLRYTEGWMDLVTGPSAVVRDVDLEVFREEEVSVLVGTVELVDDSPFGGVRVAVLGQPGYGWTYTDSQGRYAILVNGGDRTTLDFTAAGHHRLQRHVVAPWNEIWGVEPVVMTRASAARTRVRLQEGAGMSVAVGDLEVDEDGTRQAVTLFPPDAVAELVYPDGTREAIEVFDFRMTEFTVGETGPAAMPAPLPPETAYTYAVELTVDQAVARGAETVEFSRPVFNYVHDILGFGAGEEVPNGFLNRATGDWEADWNGRVVEVLAIVDGLAVLDVTGDGPATADELDELGVTPEELAVLAETHEAGDVLWRVPLTHFSARDYNWGFGPPFDAAAPPCGPEEGSGFAQDMAEALAEAAGAAPPSPGMSCAHEPSESVSPPNECNVQGSIINVQEQTLSRYVPLPGGLSLLYLSSQTFEGSVSRRTIRVPLDQGRVATEELNSVVIEIRVAGQVHREELRRPNIPDEFEWTWDGFDALGRRVYGFVTAEVSVGYRFRLVHRRAPRPAGFGDGTRELTNLQTRSSGVPIYWRHYNTFIDNRARLEDSMFGRGWTIAGLDQAQPDRSSTAQTPWQAYEHLAQGVRQWRYRVESHLGLPQGPAFASWPREAALAEFAAFRDIRRAQDGSLIMAHGRLHEDTRHQAGQVLLRHRPGGEMVEPVAGGTDPDLPLPSEGSLATEVQFASISAVALAGDRIHVAEPAQRLDGADPAGAPRVWTVEPEGTLTLAAGGGSEEPEDAVWARDARLVGPLAIDARGSALYISDQTRILRVDGAGAISVMAGDGQSGCSGDGGNAAAARVNVGEAMRVDPDGNVLFFDRTCRTLRRIRTDGTIEHYGGSGVLTYPPVFGRPVSLTALPWVESIAFSPTGRLFFSVVGRPSGWTIGRWESMILTVDDADQVEPVVGQRVTFDMLQDGEASSPANVIGEASLIRPRFGVRMVALANDNLFYTQQFQDYAQILAARRLRGLTAQSGEAITVPSRDGRVVHIYDRSGTHLESRDALTGRLVLRWIRNLNGVLVGVEDGEGRETTVSREGSTISVVDEDGDTTLLTLDETDRLVEVWPTGVSVPWRFGYMESSSLLRTVQSPRDEQWVYLSALGQYGATFTPESLEIGEPNRTLHVAQEPSGSNRNMKSASVRTAGAGEMVRLWWSTRKNGGQEAEFTSFGHGVSSRSLTARVRDNDLNQAVHSWQEDPTGTVAWTVVGDHPFFGQYVDVPVRRTLLFPERSGGSALVNRTDYAHSWDAPAGTTNAWEGTWEESATTNGRTSVSLWNPQARTFSLTSSADRTVSTTFDALGRPLVLQPDGWASTEWTWDSDGRPTLLRQRTGTTQRDTILRWDSATGLLDEIEDALGRVTRYEYDDRRLPAALVYPDGRRVEMLYDDVGNLAELRVPSREDVGEPGESHGFGWSSFHGMSMYEPPTVEGQAPAAVSTRREYDLAQRLVLLERPDGRSVEFEYDRARLAAVRSDEEEWTHAYAIGTGQLTAVTGPHANALGIDWYGPLPEAVTWSSTAGGAQGRLSWTWGEDLVPTSETITDLGNRSITLALDYDDDLLPTAMGPLALTLDPQRGSVTGLLLGNATSQQAHTPFGELDTHSTSVGGQDRYAATHTRDDLGRITTMSETVWQGGVVETTAYTYHYDPAGRLESVDENGVEAWRWQWDGNSNRIGALDALNPGGEITPADVEIDAQDRLMRYGSEVFGYNLNAEMISRTNGDDVTTYAWSVFGNLEQVMLPDGTEISYELDPSGRRVGRSVDGTRTHGWIYRDHLNPVAQLDADGRLEQVYLYGTQPHAPDAILAIGAGGAVVSTYRVVTDVRGSVRLVVNADTGAVTQELRYSPFGEVLHDSNPGFQPFGFAGGLWDADTSLVRFGAREYDGRLGRWLSRDPILFDGGDPNLFGYVLGDPVNGVDPEGLAWPLAVPIGRAIVGCVVGGATGYGVQRGLGGSRPWVSGLSGCVGGATGVGLAARAGEGVTLLGMAGAGAAGGLAGEATGQAVRAGLGDDVECNSSFMDCAAAMCLAGLGGAVGGASGGIASGYSAALDPVLSINIELWSRVAGYWSDLGAAF